MHYFKVFSHTLNSSLLTSITHHTFSDLSLPSVRSEEHTVLPYSHYRDGETESLNILVSSQWL